VITVAGVVFSITIVALQLTSTQFSPRVLRNFLRDRPNQLVLGTFMELVPLAFDQVRHYGATAPAVVIHLARGLSVLLATLAPNRHPPLRAQARKLADAASVIALEADRQRALAALQPLLG
jgi:uncharacterized membrane protein